MFGQSPLLIKPQYLYIIFILITKVSCPTLLLNTARQDTPLVAFPFTQTEAKQGYEKQQQRDSCKACPNQQPRVPSTTLPPASVQRQWTLQVSCKLT